jgi:hypothetical protein
MMTQHLQLNTILKYPSTAISIFFVGILALSIVVPGSVVARSRVVLCCILIVVSVLLVNNANQNDEEIEHQVDMLKKNIEFMVSDENGYTKNNEEIPLRRMSRFKYVYLEKRLIKLLNALFYFQSRYRDVVYSVVLYSEAFMRQIIRMMEGKVKDAKQAKALGERIINQIHTLMYMSSKYEKAKIERITLEFEQFVWNTYRVGLKFIQKEEDAFGPSAFDDIAVKSFDLHVL